jgi:intein/homing endonuclease
MIKVNCEYCGKEKNVRQKNKNGIYFCNTSCQLNWEYKNGIRNPKTITKKAYTKANKKMKIHNWLNDKSSRDKLKEVQKTELYLKHSSDAKVGNKNPMFGKYGELSSNYRGGSIRTNNGKSAYRGFDWKNIKKKVKERDNYKCRICGISEKDCKQNLQVHHIVPYSCTQDSTQDNLITVCSKCHPKQEFKFFKVKKISKKECDENVYNFSVKDDETYVANKIVVHNCRTVIRFVREAI